MKKSLMLVKIEEEIAKKQQEIAELQGRYNHLKIELDLLMNLLKSDNDDD